MTRARRLPGRPPYDPILFSLTCLLTFAGLPILYSASYSEGMALHGNPSYFVSRQVFWAAIGFLALFLTARVNLAWVRKHSRLFLLLGVGVLIATLGEEPLNGARRWLRVFGAVTLQPSEFVKVALILYLAHYLARCRETLPLSWTPVVHAGLVVGGVAGILFMQPHVSALCLVVATSVTMIILSGLPLERVASVACLLLVSGLAVYSAAPAEQKSRVRTWLGAEQNEGEQYQREQSQKALRRGGALGVGFCEGRQKLRYLPASHNDFVFSCIGEEFGFLGVLVALGCLGALVMKCYDVAHNCGSQFGSLLCSGVAMLLALQCAAHVGVATGVLPTTGVTLPLLSAGGSAMVSTLAALGLVLNVSRGVRPEVEDLDYEPDPHRRRHRRPHLSAPRSRRYSPIA